jgi:hypothetical protein
MAQYLLSVHSIEGERREPPSDEEMRDFMRRVRELEEEMNATDALLYSGRLADVDSARVVTVEGGESIVSDGPFAETKEHLGGFYIVEAKDLDDALSWASKTSACIGRPIEVRPFAAMGGG